MNRTLEKIAEILDAFGADAALKAHFQSIALPLPEEKQRTLLGVLTM